MIYFKIRKDVFNEKDFDNFAKHYPFYSKHCRALLRILKHTWADELKDYPNIDIVVTDKNSRYLLGTYIHNKFKAHKEYKFIPQLSGNPYIVLYWQSISTYFGNHCIKGFKETFLHEIYHFRQWLLDLPFTHSKDTISAKADKSKVDENLKRISKLLNKKSL